MHGPTFMATALACAVSVAAVELLINQDWRTGRRDRRGTEARLDSARSLPGWPMSGSWERWGVETHRGRSAHRHADRAGCRCLVAPFRNLIYAMPPFICPPGEVAQITSAMVRVARDLG